MPPNQLHNVPKNVSNVDRSIGTKREEKKEKKKAGEISYKLPSHRCSGRTDIKAIRESQLLREIGEPYILILAPTRELSIEIRGVLLDRCYPEKIRRNKVFPARTESETVFATNVKGRDDQAPFPLLDITGCGEVSPVFKGFPKAKYQGCNTPFNKCDVLAVEFFKAG
ncbi:hypothetical protein BDR22DRAFT_920910 [Usnea florida]